MAIVQISRIQHRRGLQQDLPQLASAELGWSLDSRRLYIGNGTIEEGAPSEGVTEILTEHTALLDLAELYTYKGLDTGFQAQTGPDPANPIVRPLQSKLDDVVSVKDFGARGDGLKDDTAAVQRALNNAYAVAQQTTNNGYHRTIYFPAGTYRVTATIDIPPYTRIQGEGKRTTIIEGSFAGPVMQFADSFGQTGGLFGSDVDGNSPEISEYHISDITIFQKVTTYDQSCLCIDGGWSSTFNRVMFKGLTNSVRADYATEFTADGTTGSYDIYTSDVAAASLPVGGYIGGAGVGTGGTVQSVSGPDGGGVYTITSDVANVDDFSDTVLVLDNDPAVQAGLPVYDIDRGPGIAAVCANNETNYAGIRNLVFNQCDFMNHNYGIECNNFLKGLSINSCYFDRLYYGILIGNNSPSPENDIPSGFSIFDNYFRWGAAEAIRCDEFVETMMSEANIFTGVGLLDYEAYAPIFNPYNVAKFPAITFTGKNNSSIGDTFERTTSDYAYFPNVETNGYECYVVGQGSGVVNGKVTNTTSTTKMLDITGTFLPTNMTLLGYTVADVGFQNFVQGSPVDDQPVYLNYTNLSVNYTISDGSNQRTGVVKISNTSGTYNWEEDYTETANLGVVFQVNTSTGDIEYTSPSSVDIIYNLTYFK